MPLSSESHLQQYYEFEHARALWRLYKDDDGEGDKLYRYEPSDKSWSLWVIDLPEQNTVINLSHESSLATQNAGTLPWELNLANQTDPILRACGVLPAFGQERHITFTKSGDFLVPVGVTKIIFICTGGGGDYLQDGGIASFGTLGSATGGRGDAEYTNAGGDGTGGNLTAKGGDGTFGGGAAGTILGIGGDGHVGDSFTGASGGPVGVGPHGPYSLTNLSVSNSGLNAKTGQSPHSFHIYSNLDVLGCDPSNPNYEYPQVLSRFLGDSYAGAGSTDDHPAGPGGSGCDSDNPDGGTSAGGAHRKNGEEPGRGGSPGGGSGGAGLKRGGGGGGFVIGIEEVTPGDIIPVTIGNHTTYGGCPSVVVRY